ncbi:MAG: bifunctional metallophosphatase/5'-nucleotidase [Saprospiraceae bacterium]|nr:bifunctional metallophosphatase/5'-nucleotidase [Saprospiraceae bacterium]
MKLMRTLTVLSLILVMISACSTSKISQTTYGKADGKVEWIFLQLNDVYEISPTENGKAGGMARVAALRQKLLNENPNTYTVLAGDFLSPSVIGTLKYEGKSIKGRQMVDVMNATGVNLVCFGNHEFDLDYVDLQARMDESKFEWISSNAFHKEGENIEPFHRTGSTDFFDEYKIITIKDGNSGESCKLGMWSVVLDANKKDYIHYSDLFERSQNIIDSVLKKQTDVVVGLTHVAIETDKELAKQNPSVSLIMGGHEHNNMRHVVGKTVITKADANAKTAYVHRCSYSLKTKQVTISSELVKIDDKMADEPTVASVVKKWEDISQAAFEKQGFQPNEVIADVSEALDGREASIRLTQTNLGAAIAKSLSESAKKPVDCSFFNSGSIRIDDQVQGKITQADIVRVMPFGGKVVEFDIKGSELRKVLLAGLLSKGRGGYLQWDKISYDDASKTLKINGQPLDESKTYHCATNDFLLSGRETNFDFFNEKNPAISNIDKPTDPNDPRSDVRKAFINYLKKQSK